MFLDVSDQEALPYATAPLLAWNHFGRKNLGFLYAIHHGAKVIYDFDDDNELKIPADGLPALPLQVPSCLVRQCVSAGRLSLAG